MKYKLYAAPGVATRLPVAVPRQAAALRLGGIDRLRITLTALVIAHHVGQAYGPTGGRWPVFEPARAEVLGAFFSVNAAFFMGLFFLLAGLFTPGAVDRKGVAGYLGERLWRLGLPLVIFTLVLFPLTMSLMADPPQSFVATLLGGLARGELEFGHLWFVLHLLIYAALYALWRVLDGARHEERLLELPAPGHGAILAYTVALWLVTALVRVWYPIDVWPRPLGVPMEVAHLPQYLSMFVLGVVAGRAGWLERLSPRVGRVWLGVGLGAAALRYAVTLGVVPLPRGLLVGGGAELGSLVWSGWEALICVGLCVGLTSLAARASVTPSAAERGMAAAAYGAYLVHIFPVVALQEALLPVEMTPLSKFALVTLLAVPVSFLIGAALRRIPGATRVL